LPLSSCWRPPSQEWSGSGCAQPWKSPVKESDLDGGHADRAFKLPNPYYFIAD
jgi:hypothetical protein